MSRRARRFVQELGVLGELVDVLAPRKGPPGGDWAEIAPGVFKRHPHARVPTQVERALDEQLRSARYVKQKFEQLMTEVHASRTRQR